MIQKCCQSQLTVEGCRHERDAHVIFTPSRAAASGISTPSSQGRPVQRGVIVLTGNAFGETLEAPRSWFV
jgi:hypothetical protein